MAIKGAASDPFVPYTSVHGRFRRQAFPIVLEHLVNRTRKGFMVEEINPRLLIRTQHSDLFHRVIRSGLTDDAISRLYFSTLNVQFSNISRHVATEWSHRVENKKDRPAAALVTYCNKSENWSGRWDSNPRPQPWQAYFLRWNCLDLVVKHLK